MYRHTALAMRQSPSTGANVHHLYLYLVDVLTIHQSPSIEANLFNINKFRKYGTNYKNNYVQSYVFMYYIYISLKVIYHSLYSMNKFVTNKSKLPQDGAQVFPYIG